MLCPGCNTCAGGAGNYSCGNSNDGAYIVDPTCGQTKDPNTPVDGRKSGSEGKRFPSLKTGEKRGTCDATTAVVTTSNGKDYKETANGDGGSTRKELDKNGKETGREETYSKSGTRTSSKEKDGTITHYGSDGKTPTSKTYPDGGTINYDSKGNPVSYTSPSGSTTPLDGPPGC